MAVVSIGDLHFSDDRPWSILLAQEVIKSIVDSPLNNPDNTLVFLGDLTERSSIGGTVYSMLMSLFIQLKYKHIYILVGNHDGYVSENKQTRKKKIHLVYNFLRNKTLKDKMFQNFTIVDTPSEYNIEGMDFLFLPHLFNDGNMSLRDYEKMRWDKKFTAVFGHFTSTFLKVPGDKINVEHISTDYWCFGHIHNPTEHYQGSHIPNSISEANQKRQVRIYDRGVQQISYVPNIIDYYTVRFPEPLPVVEAKIPVWTVYNCKDEEIAQDQYPGIYIRRCIYDIAMDNEDFDKLAKALTGEDTSTVSIESMFEDWLTFSKLSEELKVEAKLYLTNSLAKEGANAQV